MRKRAIILHLVTKQGGSRVSVPTLPGCVSQGDIIEGAVSNAREANQPHVEELLERGETAPEEPEHPQVMVVDVAT